MLDTIAERFLSQDDVARANQRRHDRHNVRIDVQVISQAGNETGRRPDVQLGCIEDLSVSGAKLRLTQPIESERIWIRLPERNEEFEFVECDVQWHRAPQDSSRTSHEYGVEFRKAVSREEFDRLFRNFRLAN